MAAEPLGPAPAEPRRASRVTLRRLMTLVAVAGVGLARVRPALAPAVVAPLLVATFVPGGASWAVVEASAAVGWLIGAIAAFSELFPNSGDVGLLLFAGAAIGASWFLRALWDRRLVRGSPPKPWRFPLVAPLAGMIGLLALATDADFRFRFAISEPALRAEATKARPGSRVSFGRRGRRIGLVWVQRIEDNPGGVLFELDGGFLDDGGLLLVGPTAVSPPTVPGIRLRPLRGPWWIYSVPF